MTNMTSASVVLPLFTRFGDVAPAPVQFNEKGKPFCVVRSACTRCAGQGGWKGWPGFTCYRCGGFNSMKHEVTEYRLYTSVELEKLNATKAKRDAKKADKAAVFQRAAEAAEAVRKQAAEALVETNYGDLLRAAEPYMERNTFIADVATKARVNQYLSEGQIVALNNAINRELAQDFAPKASFVGQIGERREFTLTLNKLLSFETQFGTMMMHIMTDASGSTVVYKGSVQLADEGETVTMVATIKEHAEYRGVNQTVVNRPKVKE